MEYEIYWEYDGEDGDYEEFTVKANDKQEAIIKAKKKAYKMLLYNYNYVQELIKDNDPEIENLKKIKKPIMSKIKITDII